jgi:hypothetical protein
VLAFLNKALVFLETGLRLLYKTSQKSEKRGIRSIDLPLFPPTFFLHPVGAYTAMRFCNYITNTASVPWNALLGGDGESGRWSRGPGSIPRKCIFCHRFQNSISKNKALQVVNKAVFPGSEVEK